MSRISGGTSLSVIVVALTFCMACQNRLSPVDVAGTYALSSTTGTIGRFETPVAGSLVLNPDAAAERRVSYHRDSTTTVTEVIDIGTYRVADSTVYLAFREDSGQSAYVWRVAATVEDGARLRLAYPRPADGTIVEVYQRR